MIINGNCLEVLKRLPSPSNGGVKCLWADIFDNIGLGYDEFHDKMKDEDYYNFVNLLLLEALPKCQLLWLSYNPKHDLEIPWMVRDILKYRHPSFEHNKFIWRYTFSEYNDYDCAYGYRPIMRLKRSDCVMYPDEIRIISRRQELGDHRAVGPRVPDNVFNVPRVVGNSEERRSWHPTQHPIKLMERIVSFSVKDSEMVMDLFGGTGSTLRAARKLGRKCVSVELSENYCKLLNDELNCGIIKFGDGFSWEALMINNH